MTKRHAEFEGTQIGFRVSIFEGKKIIASTHFKVNVAMFNRKPKVAAEAAYSEAKKFAAGFGCE